MAREPDPFRDCLPGGSCPTCNPPPVYCAACGDVRVDEVGDLCDTCQADAEDTCAGPNPEEI